MLRDLLAVCVETTSRSAQDCSIIRCIGGRLPIACQVRRSLDVVDQSFRKSFPQTATAGWACRNPGSSGARASTNGARGRAFRNPVTPRLAQPTSTPEMRTAGRRQLTSTGSSSTPVSGRCGEDPVPCGTPTDKRRPASGWRRPVIYLRGSEPPSSRWSRCMQVPCPPMLSGPLRQPQGMLQMSWRSTGTCGAALSALPLSWVCGNCRCRLVDWISPRRPCRQLRRSRAPCIFWHSPGTRALPRPHR